MYKINSNFIGIISFGFIYFVGRAYTELAGEYTLFATAALVEWIPLLLERELLLVASAGNCVLMPLCPGRT